jgi:phytoene synthase
MMAGCTFMSFQFYQGILDVIEANDYDVFSKRASLTAWGKVSRIPALWLKLAMLKQ